MSEHLPNFWRWYFVDSRKEFFERAASKWWVRLLLILASAVLLYLWIRDVFGERNSIILLALLKNPFFILLIGFVLSSHLNLEYMAYRVSLKTSLHLYSQALSQKKIRTTYKQLYGSDRFYRVYALLLLGGFICGLLLIFSLGFHWF